MCSSKSWIAGPCQWICSNLTSQKGIASLSQPVAACFICPCGLVVAKDSGMPCVCELGWCSVHSSNLADGGLYA